MLPYRLPRNGAESSPDFLSRIVDGEPGKGAAARCQGCSQNARLLGFLSARIDHDLMLLHQLRQSFGIRDDALDCLGAARNDYEPCESRGAERQPWKLTGIEPPIR